MTAGTRPDDPDDLCLEPQTEESVEGWRQALAAIGINPDSEDPMQDDPNLWDKPMPRERDTSAEDKLRLGIQPIKPPAPQRRVIRADGSRLDLAGPQTIAQLEKLIGATVLDTVSLRHLGEPLQVMFVDDLGHLKERPVNYAATDLYRANCRVGTVHEIRGDVVVVLDDDFGDDEGGID